MAMVSPSPTVAAVGVPGRRSTKKLPSRKIRGRIFSVASLWIGRPSGSIAIVTTAASVPGWRSTSLTLPMFTPAIRTGEFGRMEFAEEKTALSSNGWANGLAFVKPK